MSGAVAAVEKMQAEAKPTDPQKAAMARHKLELANLKKEFPNYVRDNLDDLKTKPSEELVSMRLRWMKPAEDHKKAVAKVKATLAKQPVFGTYGKWEARSADLQPWMNALNDLGWEIHTVLTSHTGGFNTIICKRGDV